MPVVWDVEQNQWIFVDEEPPVPRGAIVGGLIIRDHLNRIGAQPDDEQVDDFVRHHPQDDLDRRARVAAREAARDVAGPNNEAGLRLQQWEPAIFENEVRRQEMPVPRLRINPIRNEWEAVFDEDPFGRAIKAVKGVRGESLFRMILSGIKEVYDVDAVIAGGAARDFANEIEDYADVDVFLPMKWETFVDDADQLGWEKRPQLVKNKYRKTKKLPTSARAQGRVQGVTVDLVFLNKPLDFEEVAKFPVNAQKCVWTLEGGLSISPEALADHVAHTFTISPTITDKEAIEHIREKVKTWQKRKGYSDWKIVEPDIKEWWEEEKKEIVDESPFENKTKKTSIWTSAGTGSLGWFN